MVAVLLYLVDVVIIKDIIKIILSPPFALSAVRLRGVEGAARGASRHPEGATKPRRHQDSQVCRARAFSGELQVAVETFRSQVEVSLKDRENVKKSFCCHGNNCTIFVSFCQVVKRLPKTRSGKIMRRILKKVATEMTDDLGDVSTLDDPSVVKEIIQAYEQYKKQPHQRKEK